MYYSFFNKQKNHMIVIKIKKYGYTIIIKKMWIHILIFKKYKIYISLQ